MSSIRKSVRPDLAIQNSEKNKEKFGLIKGFIFFISLLGLIFALLGYGYKLGIASTFGYSPIEIVDNTSDFIYDSSVPILKIAGKVFKLSFWTDWFLSASMISLVAILIFACLCILTIVRYLRGTPERHSATISWIDNAEKATPFLAQAVLRDEPLVGVLRILLITPIYFYLGFFFIFIGIYLVISATVMVPMLGFEEGKKIAKDYIIEAERCSPHDIDKMKNKESKPLENTAQCVKVMHGNNEVVRGRVIATNSRNIYLYVRDFRINAKGEKEAFRVPKSYPIRNAVIERVDTEDRPEKK